MLVFGPYRACMCAYTPADGDILLNFSSMNQELPRLGALMPNLPNDSMIDPCQMEYFYHDYVMRDDMAFNELMNIMMPLYEGKNVFICTSGETLNQYITTMNELLMGLILNRYGYNSVVINESDDLNYFDPGDFHFNVLGIMTFDEDRKRWSLMGEVSRLRMGGKPLC